MGHLLLALAAALGFLILAATIWVPHTAATVQNQLHEQARTRLVEAGLSFAAVSVDGRDLLLSGLAPDAAARQQALDLVRMVDGVRRLDSQIELRERYVLLASLEQGQLCLRGVVPSQALRTEWQALSPLPCVRDADAALGVDDAAPSGWIWPGAVLAELLRLDRAQMEATELRVRVEGTAATRHQLDAVESALRGVVPAGVEVDLRLELAAPP